jgi:hypothetical protein
MVPVTELRSWVPLPPGPFLSVMKLRYYFELDFNNCRTKTLAMLSVIEIFQDSFTYLAIDSQNS